MAITEKEVPEAIDIKKRLREIVDSTGDKELMKADRAYHERLKRWAEDNGFGHLIAQRGGNT